MANGGADLAQVEPHVLYNIGYAELMALTHVTKEEFEAKEKLEQLFVDREFEADSGLPAMAQWLPSADQM